MTEEVVVLHRDGSSTRVTVARVDKVLYTDQLTYSPLGTRRVFWLLDGCFPTELIFLGSIIDFGRISTARDAENAE